MKTLTQLIQQNFRSWLYYQKGQKVDGTNFEKEILQTRDQLRRLPLGPIALNFADSARFAAGLLACWREGRTVFVPNDIRPETLNRLDGIAAAFVGEFGERRTNIPASKASPLKVRPLPSPAVVIFTSGSTGEPTAIAKSLHQLNTEIQELERLWSADSTVVLATVSHQHIYGLLFRLLWPLCAQRLFWAETLFFPEEIEAARSKVTQARLISSPAHLKRLPALDLPRKSWHSVFSSGGPLDWQAVQRSAASFGHPPIEVYGSSETGGIAWRQRRNENDRWTPFLNIKLSVHPSSSTLEIRSPYLPTGQRFVSADRAELHSDSGQFTLNGRADRLVKIEEKRVSLSAIERALCSSGLAKQARVFTLNEDLGGSERLELAAVIQPSEAGWKILGLQGKKNLLKKYKELAFQVVDRVALPRHFRLVCDFPQNSLGKTALTELRNLFAPCPSQNRQPAILSRKLEANELLLQLRIPPDLEGFKGHFPNFPVLPGVEQVDWAVRQAQEAFDLPGDFCGLEVLKFRKIIQAGQDLELQLNYVPQKVQVHFEYRSRQGFHASGRILFSKPRTS